jgi:hypothetical protein
MTLLSLVALVLVGSDLEVALRPIGRLVHPAIREASGIVASRKHPGIFWVHNDSGNPPRLFAVLRDGSLVREYAVSVPNIDWEDIAVDDSGHIFIGEIGNNGGHLPIRAVYQLDEPDPLRDDQAHADELPVLKVTTATYYRFPPTGRFDAEGLAVDGDRALIVAKTFDGRDAEVYAVPLAPPSPLFRPALPARIGVLPGFTRPVTGADLSRDGRRLVVCSYDAIGVYERTSEGRWTPIARRKFHGGDSVEAVAWDGDDLILAGEGRGVYRIAAADWRRDRRPAVTARPTSR